MDALNEGLADVNVEIALINEQIGELKARRGELHRRRAEVMSSRPSSSTRIEWEVENFPWSEGVRRCLQETFRLNDFRALQLSAINVVLSSSLSPESHDVASGVTPPSVSGVGVVKDCLLIASTGAGKSLCYQLPAVFLDALTLVVSPLLSLIEDQLIQLRGLGIAAATLNQNSTREEIKWVSECLSNTESSPLRLLYVTPEKLAKSKRLMHQLEKCASQHRLRLIAIDEVHCCSQWGHDFRPDYQFLSVLKRQFRRVPLLGLTATATQAVLDDVKNILGVEKAIVLRAEFNRPNLHYEVREKPSSGEHMLKELVELIKADELKSASGIIYCFTRKECEDLTARLVDQGVKAAYYHAFVDGVRRRQVHEGWLAGRYQVIVATTAFGMGIDKDNVRFVIHHSMGKSMENYYQESGRAGRDGQPARCILYYRLADAFRQSTMVCTEKTGLKNLYAMLNYAIAKSQCRRKLIASHFNERWESSWCEKMCDSCISGNVGTSEQNRKQQSCTLLLPSIMEALSGHHGSEQARTTGNKLVDLLLKPKNRTMKWMESGRPQIEERIARLLIGGFLQEDFHFTPYSVISYLSLTARGLQCIEEGVAGEETQESGSKKRKHGAVDEGGGEVVVLS